MGYGINGGMSARSRVQVLTYHWLCCHNSKDRKILKALGWTGAGLQKDQKMENATRAIDVEIRQRTFLAPLHPPNLDRNH